MSLKVAELTRIVSEVEREIEGLEYARDLLFEILRAKRAGIATPNAWSLAFDLLDESETEQATTVAPTIRCPDCKQILPNPVARALTLGADAPTTNPIRIDCGPIHLLHYDGEVVQIANGEVSVHKRDDASLDVSVFGDGDDDNVSD